MRLEDVLPVLPCLTRVPDNLQPGWMPFGGGPRLCLGYHFALAEIKVSRHEACQHLRPEKRSHGLMSFAALSAVASLASCPVRSVLVLVQGICVMQLPWVLKGGRRQSLSDQQQVY